MRQIILLAGYSGSGKDLVADWITRNFPNYIKFSFAESLKQKTAKFYGFDYEDTLTQEGKSKMVNVTSGSNKTFSVRELLIATARLVRRFDDDAFARDVVEKIKLYDSVKDKRGEPLRDIVISDWRFYNEIELIKSSFTESKIITIRINRTDKSPVTSPSEVQLDNFIFDYQLDNTVPNTKIYLFNQIDSLLRITIPFSLKQVSHK